MKFLRQRGTRYQFERPVPKNVQPTLGIKSWRESLQTDSKIEAEIRCHRKIVDTDEIIAKVLSGRFRKHSDAELDDFAIQWSTDFQLNNRQHIAAEMFPDVILDDTDPVLRLDDEAPKAIFSSRKDVQSSVAKWVNTHDIGAGLTSEDWSILIDMCLDEYLTANPELSSAWISILKERGLDLQPSQTSYHQVVKRADRSPDRNKLSSVFKEYLETDADVAKRTVDEMKTSVRRFIEIHGDIDVTKLGRTHAKEFMDKLRGLPSRPPNAVRAMPITKQFDWAQGRDVKLLGRAAVTKNLLWIKLVIQFSFDETSIFENRDWRNPFDGFGKKATKPKNPITAFTPEQLEIVFSPDVYQMKTPEKFWIPLVLLFTGARLDEICQLHVTDIRLKPVPHFMVENLDDEDEASSKKVKNISSHRTIPIHKSLIDLGFWEYFHAVKYAENLHLFPNLPHHNGGKRGNLVSTDFIRKFRKFGESNPETGLNSFSLVTHSLRHSFRVSGFRVSDQEFVQVAMGHYVSGVSYQTYGRQIYQLPDIIAERVFDVMPVPNLNFDFLKLQAKLHLEKVGA